MSLPHSLVHVILSLAMSTAQEVRLVFAMTQPAAAFHESCATTLPQIHHERVQMPFSPRQPACRMPESAETHDLDHVSLGKNPA